MGDDLRRQPEGGEGASEEGEPQKGYQEILAAEIQTGLTELERPSGGLLLSGLSAGLDVSFSLLLMAVMTTLAAERVPKIVSEILVANMYSVGFIFVVLGRSELFTEHTTLAVLPVLDGRASVRQLGRLWGLIYVSNLVGAAMFAGFAVLVAPALGIVEPFAFGKIAHGAADHPAWVLLTGAVLAGWLMGLITWLVAASRDSIGQIFLVWLVTSSIGLLHLQHCVVGTTEVLAGVFAGQDVSMADFFRFLVLTTAGNVAGSVVFVALIKYGHAKLASGRR